MPFLLPYVRIELLIRTMLTETWAPEAWPVVKHECVTCVRWPPDAEKNERYRIRSNFAAFSGLFLG
jgi:hypothetical protein